MKQQTENFRIKIVIAVYVGKHLIYKNNRVIDKLFSFVQVNAEIVEAIRREITHKGFFRSPNPDYDVIQYQEEGRQRTYLRFSHIKAVDLVA